MSRKEVALYDEIGYWGVAARDFRARLSGLELKPEDELLVALNSPGGEIYEGMAIYSMIKHAPVAKRTVRVDGLAASMGSIIAMAGDDIEMGDGSLMMVHDPSGMCWGTADDARELAEVLDKHKAALCAIYERRTGKTADEIAALMTAETWFTGPEAVAAGFATRVGPAVSAEARFRAKAFDRYGRAPAAARSYFIINAAPPRPVPPPPAAKEPIMNEEQKRRRGLGLGLLCALSALAASDPTDPELAAAAKEAEPRAKALRGAGAPDLGSPLAVVEALEATSAKAGLSFTDAQAEVLALAARVQVGVTSEEAVKAQLLEEAIKAGKPIAPAHRAIWQKLPVAKLRETLDALPVVNSLPQGARTPSQNPHAGENERMQGDESYRAMHEGLGIKPKKAEVR